MSASVSTDPIPLRPNGPRPGGGVSDDALAAHEEESGMTGGEAMVGEVAVGEVAVGEAAVGEAAAGEVAVAAPRHDCALCPRLVAYRQANQAAQPGWFNAPVPSFGPTSASLLVVGMAPGVKGANRTGRPFTGDHAGLLLYSTLLRFGRARGEYGASADDGVELIDTRITNAVRCVPPANLPEPGEVTTCNPFLRGELQALPHLRAVLALGVLAHAAVLKACGIPPARIRFRHGAMHLLPDGLILANSYHVSRYNTNTGRLTTEMFEAVMFALGQRLAEVG